MKKFIIALAAFLFIASSSWAQEVKAKAKQEKAKVKGPDGSKTKIKDDKIKSKDTAGNKTKIKAPAPVIKSFTADFPNIKDATWTSKRGNWSATYMLDGRQTTTTYRANGDVVDTRTIYPLDQLPQPVITYRQQNAGFTPTGVVLITRPNHPDVYELKSTSGTVYIGADGAVTTYQEDK